MTFFKAGSTFVNLDAVAYATTTKTGKGKDVLEVRFLCSHSKASMGMGPASEPGTELASLKIEGEPATQLLRILEGLKGTESRGAV